jgi:hypothetical protein
MRWWRRRMRRVQLKGVQPSDHEQAQGAVLRAPAVLKFSQRGGGTNKGFSVNSAVDRLIDDNIREHDLRKRAAAVKEAQGILLDDAAWPSSSSIVAD